MKPLSHGLIKLAMVSMMAQMQGSFKTVASLGPPDMKLWFKVGLLATVSLNYAWKFDGSLRYKSPPVPEK